MTLETSDVSKILDETDLRFSHWYNNNEWLFRELPPVLRRELITQLRMLILSGVFGALSTVCGNWSEAIRWIEEEELRDRRRRIEQVVSFWTKNLR